VANKSESEAKLIVSWMVGSRDAETANLFISHLKAPAGEPRPTHNGQLAGLPYHCHALALYFVWYNWIRIHKTLRVMPAMAAGLTDKVMDMTAWWR